MRIAVLDFNNGCVNQGMDNIRDILQRYAGDHVLELDVVEFDVRQRLELPDTSFDCYISSGGPGSPLADGAGEWEERYFDLIGDIFSYNKTVSETGRKFMFFICHSFQLACRYFGVGRVCRRKSASFGVFPTHKTLAGLSDPSFAALPDPFFTVDSREWQVIATDAGQLHEFGASVLAIEKERPYVPLERAVMAVRFSPEMVGTQFHPEADARVLARHLMNEERKQQVINQYGYAKYEDIMVQLDDPDKIMRTQHSILPAFLDVVRQSRTELQDAAV